MSDFSLSWIITFLIWGFVYLFSLLIAKIFQLIFKVSNDKIKNFLQTILILLICSVPFIIYFGPKGSLLVLLLILYLAAWVNLTLLIVKIFYYLRDRFSSLKKISNFFGKLGLIIILFFWGLFILDTAENIGKILSNNYYFVKYIKY
jgi:hypothetical protein